MSNGPLVNSQTASTSGLCELDHWTTPELSVQNTVPQPKYTSIVLYVSMDGVTVNLHTYYLCCSLVLRIKQKKSKVARVNP